MDFFLFQSVTVHDLRIFFFFFPELVSDRNSWSFQGISDRKIRFTSSYPPKDLFENIQKIVMDMGFQVQKKHSKVPFPNTMDPYLILSSFPLKKKKKLE